MIYTYWKTKAMGREYWAVGYVDVGIAVVVEVYQDKIEAINRCIELNMEGEKFNQMTTPHRADTNNSLI